MNPNLMKTKLSCKHEFYSNLKGEGISDEDYEHAQNVWNAFDCKSFKDYNNIYLKTDVILLSDVFENFRCVFMKTYELDPAHFYTAPGLSWNAFLKYSEVKLEHIRDPDILLFAERGIRGGVSTGSRTVRRGTLRRRDSSQ